MVWARAGQAGRNRMDLVPGVTARVIEIFWGNMGLLVHRGDAMRHFSYNSQVTIASRGNFYDHKL